MPNPIEDPLIKIQSKMISACLHYVGQAEMVFIYCAGENNLATVNFFFRINGELVRKHKVNELENISVDDSQEAQAKVLSFLCGEFRRMIEVCKLTGLAVPTEIKISYEVATQRYNADYRYDAPLGNDILLSGVGAANWFHLLESWTPPLIPQKASGQCPEITRETTFGHSFQVKDNPVPFPPERVGNLKTVTWDIGLVLAKIQVQLSDLNDVWFIQVDGQWRQFLQDKAHPNIQSLMNNRLESVRVELIS